MREELPWLDDAGEGGRMLAEQPAGQAEMRTKGDIRGKALKKLERK